MKIKVTKKLTLFEILQKFDAGEVPIGEYKSKDGKYIEIYDNAEFRFGSKNTVFPRFRLSDTYEVEVEETITEDMEFDVLIEVFDEKEKFDKTNAIIYHNKRIEDVKDVGSFVSRKFYALIDGELQLVWENDMTGVNLAH